MKVIEADALNFEYLGTYHKIAVRVRDLLKCDYALVATPEKNDRIRIQAIAGGDHDSRNHLAVDLVSKLRGWGPVTVDYCRLVAVPVLRGPLVIGLLAGYSARFGKFTSDDLEDLMAYSPVAAKMLEDSDSGPASETRTTFDTSELLHYSRLITIGELSACFAHEVTNPLMLIRGHLRFVEEGLAQDDPLRTNFDVIDRASRRIEEMAKRMLDFSRKRTPRKEPCDIGELIADAIRFVQPYFRTRYINVHLDLQPNLPATDLDRWQVIQAIINLLQNAADAMAELEKRVLSITARMEGDKIRISISDTGTGVDSANVSRIFDPFFTTKGEGGTGLGLYITKQVIEDHDGTINVHTGVRGTTFIISLPY